MGELEREREIDLWSLLGNLSRWSHSESSWWLVESEASFVSPRFQNNSWSGLKLFQWVVTASILIMVLNQICSHYSLHSSCSNVDWPAIGCSPDCRSTTGNPSIHSIILSVDETIIVPRLNSFHLRDRCESRWFRLSFLLSPSTMQLFNGFVSIHVSWLFQLPIIYFWLLLTPRDDVV